MNKNSIYKFLRKSQKFTGTDNIYIAKYGSYLTIGNIISTIASFLLAMAFARLLPKETYGQYKYILSIVAILSIFSLQGMNKAIIQGVAKGFDGVLKKGFKAKLKWSLLGSVASIGIAIYFWLQGNIEFTISFLIIATFLPLFKSGEIYQFYLSGKKMFGKKVSYTVLTQLLSTAFLLLTLFLTTNLIILILVYFLSYSALRNLFLFLTIKKTKLNKLEDPGTISYGKHLSLMSILGIISQQIDKILLFSLLGPIQLAIYSFAVLPIQYIRAPLQNIQELAFPKLSARSKQEIKKTLPKKLIKSVLLILPMIIIYIVIAPYFYKIFFPQYTDSIFYSRLFSITLLVFPISMMQLSLLAQRKTKDLYKINIILPIIQILLFVVLIPLYGILGVIIALLLSQALHLIIVWFFFKQI